MIRFKWTINPEKPWYCSSTIHPKQICTALSGMSRSIEKRNSGTYSVVSLAVFRLDKQISPPLLLKIFKWPSILGQEGHRHLPKHSNNVVCGWKTNNHPPTSYPTPGCRRDTLLPLYKETDITMADAKESGTRKWPKLVAQNKQPPLFEPWTAVHGITAGAQYGYMSGCNCNIHSVSMNLALLWYNLGGRGGMVACFVPPTKVVAAHF